MTRACVLAAALGCATAVAAQAPAPPPPDPLETLVQSYLWPSSAAELHAAETTLNGDPALNVMSRERFHDLEEAMRRGRRVYPPAPVPENGRFATIEMSVEVPHGLDVPLLIQLPSRYTAQTDWPLLFAMHGGPPGSANQARAGAERMISVWSAAAERAGWIVAAPALTPSVTAGPRTEQRLPYEVFHAEQAHAVLAALRVRFRINPERMVSTGISLGSNYSIAFGTSDPGWFSAIVPVSTEGDSRERLLRNLKTVPMYILEGAQDKNIRAISGPRALRDILVGFGYDLTYREFSDRAHEGFQEHYDDVLRWLEARPRNAYPREVLRVPNDAITPLARRTHWVEPDTRQAFVAARVAAPSRIDVTARWARTLNLYLHDRLVSLDRPVEVWVNGVEAFSGTAPRSARIALDNARARGDERLIDAAVISVDLPATPGAIAAAERAWGDLAPTHPEGTLSFWEMYATRALEERVPALGFDASEEPVPPGVKPAPEQVGLRVRQVVPGTPFGGAGLLAGDLLLSVGGEPFFRGRGGSAALHRWLIRELRSEPAEYAIVVWRHNARVTLGAQFKLGAYADPKPSSSGRF